LPDQVLVNPIYLVRDQFQLLFVWDDVLSASKAVPRLSDLGFYQGSEIATNPSQRNVDPLKNLSECSCSGSISKAWTRLSEMAPEF
jgi:hypothetical protein